MRNWQLVVLCAATMFGAVLLANEKPSESYSKAMKETSATQQKLAKDADAKDYDAIAADAAIIKTNIREVVGKYWTDVKSDDGVTKAKAAYAAADDLEKAAKAKDEMGVADARKVLQATCGSCHTAHRERLPDGSFEIK